MAGGRERDGALQNTGTSRLFCSNIVGTDAVLETTIEGCSPTGTAALRPVWRVPAIAYDNLSTDPDQYDAYLRDKRVNCVLVPRICGVSGNPPIMLRDSSAARRQYAVGATVDFAIEMWIKSRFDPRLHTYDAGALMADTNLRVGCFSDGDADDVYFGIVAQGAGLLHAIYRESGAINFTISSSATIPLGWNHYAINYDRDGNMEFFINGRSQGTISIAARNAANLGTRDFSPFSAGPASPLMEGPNNPFMTGPCALHVGAGSVLTAAELDRAVAGKTTINQGSTITQARYDWRDIKLMNNGIWIELSIPADTTYGSRNTGFSPISLLAFATSTANGVRFIDTNFNSAANPKTTSTEIVAYVPDSSGNGNHAYIVFTSGVDWLGRSHIFADDPFWG